MIGQIMLVELGSVTNKNNLISHDIVLPFCLFTTFYLRKQTSLRTL
jgi:hypothetical protein